MIGPVEQRLRARLNYGLGLSRVEVHAFGGQLARGILDRMVRDGEAVERDGRFMLAGHSPDPAALAAEQAARLARIAEKKRLAEELAAREMRARAERDAAAHREREQRALVAGLDAYAQAERQLVLRERAAALREAA